MRTLGVQAVVAQTAFNVVIALELMSVVPEEALLLPPLPPSCPVRPTFPRTLIRHAFIFIFPVCRSKGIWKGAGVLGPEVFDPLPFMDRMAEYGFPWGIMEVKPRGAGAASSS
jgi:hypothetical protein